MEKTGLQAVFETKEFQQGLQTYLSGLQKSNSATDQASSGITSAGGAASTAGSLFGTGLSGGMIAAGAAALAFVAIGKKVIDTIVGMIDSAKEFIGDSIVLASRWQELSMVAQLMGQRIGMSSQEILDLNDKMQEAGIRADVANKAIAQFVRMEMSPDMALELGKVAQNLAVISQDGADSSETLDRLMLGIQRLSPVILRTAGANVDLNQSYQDYAATMGIVGRELTQVEKQQAAYNAVLEQGAMVAGIYEVAMDSAGKQMRSLTGREIPTLQNALGAPFQGAFLNVAKAAREVVSSFTAAISEGGALYPVMIRLGAIAEIITDALRNLATRGTQAVIDFLSNLNFTFSDSIRSAFEWGFELVVNFAQGIVEAASSVLVGAINFLGSVISGWLAPGSPPKVAPDIIKWGSGAMTEYLKGFTSADFSVLKDIQSPLKSALDVMVSAGETTKKKATKIFLDLSEDISKALAGDGELDQGLIDKITEQTGEFGREIAKLTQDQFALSSATNEVAEAQEKVNDAMEQQANSEKAVRDLTDEYNRLLRAGASDEVLKAQLDQINAAEEQAALAQEQRTIAEEDLSEKESTLSILEEQVKLQSELVKQLLQLSKEAILPGTVDGLDGIGVGGFDTEGAGGGFGAGFEIDKDAFIDKIREAVTAAKEELKARFSEAWDSIKQIFTEKFGESISEVSLAWQNFTGIVKQFWDEKVLPVFQAIQEWAETTLPTAWEALTSAIETAINWYTENMVPVLEAIWQILSDIGDILITYFTPQWEAAKEAVKLVSDFFKDTVVPLITDLWNELDLASAATTGWTMMIEALEDGLKWVLLKLQSFHSWLQKVKDLILGMPTYDAVTENSPVPMAEGLKKVNEQLANFHRSLMTTKQTISDLNMSSLIAPTMSAQSMISPSANRVMNMNQTNYIQSPMDMATFRAMFNQVIREQFAGV